MGEEVVGLVQVIGGIAAQCYAPRIIKSAYIKSFEKICSYEITNVVKELFRNNESPYTKTVLSYMKTPDEEIETLLSELMKKNVRPEVRETLNLAKALELYELIYNNYLKSPLYMLYKDNISEHINTIKKWLEDNQNKVKITPQPAASPLEEGSKLLDARDYEKAMKKFREASQVKEPAAFANMGNVYFLQGNFKEALDNYLEAVKLKPEEAGYHITLGNIYDKLARYDEADCSYRRAIGLEPEMQEIIYEKRLFDFWKNKNITEIKKSHLKKLLSFMSVPASRAELIEKQVKKSLGIMEEIIGVKTDNKKMKALLKIEDGPGGKEQFEFDRHDTFVVGRSKINTHSQLKGDGYISRHHFMLELNPPYCFLKDLGSTNGTKLNGRKLEKGELIQLSPGDQINVGKTTLSININQEESDEKQEIEGTLILNTEVWCIECGKEISGELSDKPAQELVGLIYTCLECASKKEVHTMIEAVGMEPVLCSGCNKDMKTMANRDGKEEALRGTALYLCSDCRPTKDPNLKTDKIGDYEIIKLLGKGGMGEVYKAWHILTGRLVAIKKILPMAAMNEKNHKLFQREMAVMAKLIHPNIVRLYDQGRIGKEHYFATEFLNEGDASGLIEKKLSPYPYRDACNIIAQTLAGLEFSHSKNYIHRDIKPQNILIDRDKGGLKAKLSDFGLAKNFQDAGGSMMTKEGEIAGTVLFMAPEQLLNYKYVKPPADVYSMGITLYYLLTGRYPFDYPSPLDIIQAMLQGIKINMKKYPDPLLLVLSEQPIPVEKRKNDMPAAIARVVNKSIMKNEKERYQSAKEFREDILNALGTC